MPLLIVEHPGPRRGAKLPPRVLIGRRSMNHLVVDHPDVSRMHAWIDRVGDDFVLTDMRSRSGTTVNGRPLPRSRALVDGDVIRVGPAKLTFLASDALPPGVDPLVIPRMPAVSHRDVGVRFDCPHCRAPMWAAPQFATHFGSCVYCGEEFTVPTGPPGPDGLAIAGPVPADDGGNGLAGSPEPTTPAAATGTAGPAATDGGASAAAAAAARLDPTDSAVAADTAAASASADPPPLLPPLVSTDFLPPAIFAELESAASGPLPEGSALAPAGPPAAAPVVRPASPLDAPPPEPFGLEVSPLDVDAALGLKPPAAAPPVRPVPIRPAEAAAAAPAKPPSPRPRPTPRPGLVQMKPDAGTLAAAEGFAPVTAAPVTTAPPKPTRPTGPAPTVPAVPAAKSTTATAAPAAPAVAAGRAQAVAPTVALADPVTSPVPAPTRPAVDRTDPAVPPIQAVARPRPATVDRSGDRTKVRPTAPPSTAQSPATPARANGVAQPAVRQPQPVRADPAMARGDPPAPAARPPTRPPQPPTDAPAAPPAVRCGVCQSTIEPGEARTVCPSCGLLFHEECWQENYGCSAYGCAQVNALAPPEPDVGQQPTVDEAAGDLSDVPPPPRKPWEFVLLAASVLAAVAGAFTFGATSLVALAAAVAYLVRTRRDDDRNTAAVIGAIALSAVGVAAGAATSYFLFFYGRR